MKWGCSGGYGGTRGEGGDRRGERGSCHHGGGGCFEGRLIGSSEAGGGEGEVEGDALDLLLEAVLRFLVPPRSH